MQNTAIQILKSTGYQNVEAEGSCARPLAEKMTLSNGMEVFDFDEDAIIAKMESMMHLLDKALS